jgi:Bacterial transglutaminase-like N-terminal region
MKLSIHHRTTYRYARPVVLQPHRMMLRPRGSHDIAVLASSLVCTPPAEIDWTQDVFGNLIATGIFAELAAELVIASELTVEQSAVAWPVFRIAPEAHSFPFAYSPNDLADLGALCMPEHGDPEGRMEGWARAFVRGGSTDTLSLLKHRPGADRAPSREPYLRFHPYCDHQARVDFNQRRHLVGQDHIPQRMPEKRRSA